MAEQITTEKTMKIIEQELLYFVPGLKADREKLQHFMRSIQPEVDQALASGDVMSLAFLRDRMIGRTGRISLGTIYRQRAQVQTVVMTVIRTLVSAALVA
jgi:hypothetical protein